MNWSEFTFWIPFGPDEMSHMTQNELQIHFECEPDRRVVIPMLEAVGEQWLPPIRNDEVALIYAQ